uniref:Nucleotide-diphospho-sugar transferase domain-containing protein n=2 Tax=Aegilops tauschii subsp. strangulata TaxID=200361 RepID=A0A453QZI0_AEGTS
MPFKGHHPRAPDNSRRRPKMSPPAPSHLTGAVATAEPFRVYVGYDSREDIAYRVCRRSLLRRSSVPLEVIPIVQQELREAGLYWRERGSTESTEFSFTRFLTPHLAGYRGWALFVDCDFLFVADVRGGSGAHGRPSLRRAVRAPRLHAQGGHQDGRRRADGVPPQELVLHAALQLRPSQEPRRAHSASIGH